MPDESVNKWKQQGCLYLWRYLENIGNFPGWHLTADKLFCQNFADLTTLMFASRWNSQKALSVTPPNAKVLRIPNNRGDQARWKTAQSFLLKYPKNKAHEDYFALEESESIVILSVGTQKLQLFSECIDSILHGKNDYSIGSHDSPRLWFW